jgi:hypothetical protein
LTNRPRSPKIAHMKYKSAFPMVIMTMAMAPVMGVQMEIMPR